MSLKRQPGFRELLVGLCRGQGPLPRLGLGLGGGPGPPRALSGLGDSGTAPTVSPARSELIQNPPGRAQSGVGVWTQTLQPGSGRAFGALRCQKPKNGGGERKPQGRGVPEVPEMLPGKREEARHQPWVFPTSRPHQIPIPAPGCPHFGAPTAPGGVFSSLSPGSGIPRTSFFSPIPSLIRT